MTNQTIAIQEQQQRLEQSISSSIIRLFDLDRQIADLQKQRAELSKFIEEGRHVMAGVNLGRSGERELQEQMKEADKPTPCKGEDGMTPEA